MQNVDQPRLDELGYWQRCRNADQRFVRKTDGAFWHCVDVAGEADTGKIIEKIGAKSSRAPEPVNFRGGKPQRFEIGEGVLEPSSQQETAPGGQPPNKELKNGLFVFAAVQVGLDHVEFVKIGGERTCEGRHDSCLPHKRPATEGLSNW